MQIFNKITFAVVALFCAIVLASCEKNENGIIDDYDYTTYDSTISQQTITLWDVFEALKIEYQITDEMVQQYWGADPNALKLLNRNYEATAIRYKTVAPDGSPILASGVVYFPLGAKPKGVVEVSPFNQYKDSCASIRIMKADAMASMFNGYICILPDLVGCGETANLPIEYMQHDNIAIISADMRKAAEEYLYTHHRHKMSNESILFGYSLGGSGIMALAREYYLNPSRGVTVKELFTGGGVYEPMVVFDEVMKTGEAEYAILPNVLWSIDYYDKLNLDYTKIFKGQLLENYNTWCQGYIPINDLTAMLGTDINAYFSEYMLNGFKTADDFAQLRQTIDAKSIRSDWTPKAKIHLFHAAGDTHVPTVLSDRLYERLKNSGVDVEYQLYEVDHVTAGLCMSVDFAKYLMTL